VTDTVTLELELHRDPDFFIDVAEKKISEKAEKEVGYGSYGLTNPIDMYAKSLTAAILK